MYFLNNMQLNTSGSPPHQLKMGLTALDSNSVTPKLQNSLSIFTQCIYFCQFFRDWKSLQLHQNCVSLSITRKNKPKFIYKKIAQLIYKKKTYCTGSDILSF